MSEITELERQFASEIAERRHGDDCTASDLANRLMPFLAEVRRQAAEEALLKAAASFEATDHAWGKLAMIEHLRARAAAYRREETE